MADSSVISEASPAPRLQHPTVLGEVATSGTASRDAVVLQLVRSLNDADRGVQEAARRSLHLIGLRHTALVLTSCMHVVVFEVAKTAETSTNRCEWLPHRVRILELMSCLLDSRTVEVDEEVAERVQRFALLELSCESETIHAWQDTAASILRLLCEDRATKVLDVLTKLVWPNILPHQKILSAIVECASAKPVAFTVHLERILKILVPQLVTNVRTEEEKIGIADALQSFACAFATFLNEASDEARRAVNTERLVKLFTQAIETLSTRWLPSRSFRLRCSVSRALGSLGCVTPLDAFPKALSLFVSFYRKEKPHQLLPLTKGFCHFLCESGIVLDVAQVQSIVGIWITTVALPGENFHTDTRKALNLVVRTLTHLCSVGFVDTIVALLVSRLESRDELHRASALRLLHPLLLLPQLAPSLSPTLRALHALVNDTGAFVRLELLRIVATLIDSARLLLDDCRPFITFSVRACADADVGVQQLARYLVATEMPTRPEIHIVLWPRLVGLLIPVEFECSFSSLAHCICGIAESKLESGSIDANLLFGEHSGLPSRAELFVRLLSFLSRPRPLALSALSLLSALLPSIDKSLADAAANDIARMRTMLTTHQVELFALHQQQLSERTEFELQWRTQLNQLFLTLIEAVSDASWLLEIYESVSAQRQSHCEGNQDRKHLLSRMRGVLLTRVTNASYVLKRMQELLDDADHAVRIEQDVIADTFGLVASEHFHTVTSPLLSALDRTDAAAAKAGGLFSFGKSKELTRLHQERSTIAFCLAACCQRAPEASMRLHASQLVPCSLRLMEYCAAGAEEAPVLLLEAALKFVRALACNLEGLNASTRHNLLYRVLESWPLVQSCKLSPLGIQAVTALVQQLRPIDKQDVVAVLDKTMGTMVETLESEAVEAEMNENLQELCTVLVGNLPRRWTVLLIMGRVEHLLAHSNAVLRRHSTELYLSTVQALVAAADTTNDADDVASSRSGWPLPRLLGALVPRCADADVRCRRAAIESVQMLLYTQRTDSDDEEEDEDEDEEERKKQLKCFHHIRDSPTAAAELAVALAALVPLRSACRPLLAKLVLNGAVDPDASAAHGALETLLQLLRQAPVRRLLRTRSSYGLAFGSACVDALAQLARHRHQHQQQQEKEEEMTSRSELVVRCFAETAGDDLRGAICSLFSSMVPPSTELVLLLARLYTQLDDGSPRLVAEIARGILLSQLTTTTNDGLDDAISERISSVAVLVVVQLCSRFEDVARQIVRHHFAELMVALLGRIAFCCGREKNWAVGALAAVFKRSQFSSAENDAEMQRLTEQLSETVYDPATASLIHTVLSPSLALSLFNVVREYIGSCVDCTRVVCTTVYSEIALSLPSEERSVLVQSLVPLLGDRNGRVRIRAFIGVERLMNDAPGSVTHAIVGSVVSSLATEAPEEEVEVALRLLKTLLVHAFPVPTEMSSGLLLRICEASVSSFGSGRASVRSLACSVFVALCAFARCEPLLFETHTQRCLMPLCILLDDAVTTVRQQARHALDTVIKLINDTELNALLDDFQPNPDDDNDDMAAFESFSREFCSALVARFAGAAHTYVASASAYLTTATTASSGADEIVGGAALVLAHLMVLRQQPEESEELFDGMKVLLGHRSARVRARVARALGDVMQQHNL